MNLEELNDRINLGKRYPDYFNQWVMWGSLALLTLYFVAAVWTNGWSGHYNCCPETANLCVNSEYDPAAPLGSDKGVLYMTPGQCFGHKPNWLAEGWGANVLLILIGTFALNHYLWRKKQ